MGEERRKEGAKEKGWPSGWLGEWLKRRVGRVDEEKS